MSLLSSDQISQLDFQMLKTIMTFIRLHTNLSLSVNTIWGK